MHVFQKYQKNNVLGEGISLKIIKNEKVFCTSFLQ